jgi:hypothetical protein
MTHPDIFSFFIITTWEKSFSKAVERFKVRPSKEISADKKNAKVILLKIYLKRVAMIPRIKVRTTPVI